MDSKTLYIPRIESLDSLTDTHDIIRLLDDQGTRASVDTCNWPDKYPYRPLATFVAAHTGQNLYIDFLVRCNYLRAENTADQSPVSQDSCVEFFVEPKPGGHYWNFEFNCIGAINASHRAERPKPVRLTTEELAMVRRYASCGNRPFKELEGLFTWNLMVVIPLALIGADTPIALGTAMRGNFYKCASACSMPHYLSWNAIRTDTPDFHRPESFGTLIFE